MKTMEQPFRYRELGYAALDVTDLDRSVSFYRDLVGLELTYQDEDAAFFRCSSDHHNLVLYRAAVPGLRRVGFELESVRELDHAWQHFTSRGLQPVELPREECAFLKQGRSMRVREPSTGLTFEFYAEVMQLVRPFVPSHTKIERLGHVVIGTSAFDATYQSLLGDFGFKVSDYTPGKFAFLRCFPNPYHHSFAIGETENNRLHHVNFMVSEIDDIGRAVNRLRNAGVEISFGPGRHHTSGSMFLYFSDPDGLTAEYSFGMEELPESTAREPRMMERGKQAADLWGGVPTDAFGATGRIA